MMKRAREPGSREEEASEESDSRLESASTSSSSSSSEMENVDEDSLAKDLEPLSDIFWNMSLERQDPDMLATIMRMLREHPDWALQRFKNSPYSRGVSVPVNPRTTSRDGVELFPFTYLLIGGASLDVLQEVANNMGSHDWTMKERMADGIRYFLLEVVCRHRSGEPHLVRFIAEKSKDAGLSHGIFVSNPVVIAMDKYAPLETIQALLEIYPRLLGSRDKSSEMDCLHRALWSQSPAEQEVIDFLIAKTAESFNPTSHMELGYSGYNLATQASKAILDLLPHYKWFSVHGNWQTEAWLQLVQNNAPRDCSTNYLQLVLPEELPEESLDPACEALSRFFSSFSSLRQLRLSRPSCDTSSNIIGSRLMRCIVGAVRRWNSIHLLELSGFHVDDEDATLINLLVVESNLQSVVLDNLHASGSQVPTLARIESASPIQTLALSHCKIPSAFLQELLLIVSKMPVLKFFSLEVKTESWVHLGESIARLLDCNTLTKLDVQDSSDEERSRLDLSYLGDALRRNTSLEYLTIKCRGGSLESIAEALEEDNTTLVGCEVIPADKAGLRKAKYYANLNQWGRGTVREEATTTADLLELLRIVTGSPKKKHQVAYGLLRDRPELWCNTGHGAGGTSSARLQMLQARREG